VGVSFSYGRDVLSLLWWLKNTPNLVVGRLESTFFGINYGRGRKLRFFFLIPTINNLSRQFEVYN
jgi:hypothetical protein